MCSCIWDVYFDHVLTQRFLIFDISIMWCLLCYHGRTCSRVETLGCPGQRSSLCETTWKCEVLTGSTPSSKLSAIVAVKIFTKKTDYLVKEIKELGSFR